MSSSTVAGRASSNVSKFVSKVSLHDIIVNKSQTADIHLPEEKHENCWIELHHNEKKYTHIYIRSIDRSVGHSTAGRPGGL